MSNQEDLFGHGADVHGVVTTSPKCGDDQFPAQTLLTYRRRFRDDE
jgi:hypothetical protein